MGRPRKPIEQHKIQGTYRKDRHGNSAELVIADFIGTPVKPFPPESLTDDLVREHYTRHIELLSSLHVLAYSDVPEIDAMYEALQEYRRVYAELRRTSLEDIDRYEKLSDRLLKFGQRFSTLASKYCVSPAARNKLTLEAIQIKKEVENRDSITARLINRKRS
jgi:hypothetical protein